ncbi:putative phosphoglycerate mutase [Streptosporangium becharense]|uniref:Putative phosphoglycerate mutase n=1 Tax=Streptosporangium becharense TaxID=1816182 RepID=A0A7W9IL34_9ACTN|nr:histidine phosphatase family protein [Streptosporangium becharense]MBB2911862.1 putative phosphoglycerate mutase [Streptosporangium becharense]MBB5822320.1 putative phosphoglycerate mutase [Streptosporangium becharense]
MTSYVIEADGGSRGNPGPAGYGAVVRDAADGQILVETAEAIGTQTNNVAEYRGLIAGLDALLALAGDGATVEVRMDSKLVVEQMAGRWKIKNEGLRPLALQAAALARRLRVTWKWIPRELNKDADRLANEAMDAAAKGLPWRLAGSADVAGSAGAGSAGGSPAAGGSAGAGSVGGSAGTPGVSGAAGSAGTSGAVSSPSAAARTGGGMPAEDLLLFDDADLGTADGPGSTGDTGPGTARTAGTSAARTADTGTARTTGTGTARTAGAVREPAPALSPESPERESPAAGLGSGWRPPTTVATSLYLLRHGETPLSVGRRFSGLGDPELTPNGVAQAEAAAARLARDPYGIQVIVSSPLRRARATAEAVAARTGLEVVVEEGLRETDFGLWEGHTFTEIQRRWPDELAAWLADPSAAPPGGESFGEAARRVQATRDALLERYEGRRVLAVSHVTPIKMLLRLALLAPLDALYRMHLDLSALSLIEYYADGPALVKAFNDTSHLR